MKVDGKRPADRIEIDPQVMFGKPVIRGTRIPVDLILRKLSEGLKPEAILASHPRLIREDIDAALAYAADVINGIDTVELPVAHRA